MVTGDFDTFACSCITMSAGDAVWDASALFVLNFCARKQRHLNDRCHWMRHHPHPSVAKKIGRWVQSPISDILTRCCIEPRAEIAAYVQHIYWYVCVLAPEQLNESAVRGAKPKCYSNCLHIFHGWRQFSSCAARYQLVRSADLGVLDGKCPVLMLTRHPFDILARREASFG